MQEFTKYLAEGNKGLTIFDIDDTMFKTKARVLVKNTKGGTPKPLTPQQFNSYKLSKGEYYDYGEFKSSKLFFKTAIPIGKMISKAKAIIRNATAKGSKVIIVTARADMDDRDLFIRTFEEHGIPMDKVYVERAGNMSNKSSAAAKQIIFRKYLKTEKYARIRLFDDHKENLDALLELKREFPHVNFEAYLVNKEGRVKKQ
tara:strand:- start:1523 stop:2125 length:603 start_codon:yes stop_codon:yes gene_type:complete